MAVSKKRRKAPKTQQRRARPSRDVSKDNYWQVTHHPLQSLVFLLPMILAYEIGTAMTIRTFGQAQHRELAASQLLHWFFSLFGASSVYLPGAVLIVVLLGWHIIYRYPWKVRPMALLGMAAESIGLAMLLVLLNFLLHSVGQPDVLQAAREDIRELLFSIGAGIYEELVFRLIVIAALSVLFDQLLRMREAASVALIVILSSLFFAVSHHEPIGADAWDVQRFAFRAAAGAYLAAVFVLRGFGLAVGCHVVYDVIAYLSATANGDAG